MGIRATRIAPPRFVGAASSRVHDKRLPHEPIDARPLFQAILRAFLLVVTAVCILTFLGYNPGSPLPRGVPLRPGHRTSALARASPSSSVATPPCGPGRGNRKPRRAGSSCDGASRARTGDLLGAIQALSQLSYSPERTEV